MNNKQKILNKIIRSIGRYHLSILALFMFNILFIISVPFKSLLLSSISLIGVVIMGAYSVIQSAHIVGQIIGYNKK